MPDLAKTDSFSSVQSNEQTLLQTLRRRAYIYTIKDQVLTAENSRRKCLTKRQRNIKLDIRFRSVYS